MNIGVLGGGQLGRMLALAAYPLGLSIRFYDQTDEAPVGRLAELHVGAFDDEDKVAAFARGLDVVTYEFENVPAATADLLAPHVRVLPPPAALDAAQDRLNERRLFQRLGIPTPTFAPVDSLDDAAAHAKACGYKAILKARRFGYDGKGQDPIASEADVPTAWEHLRLAPGGLILDQMIPFTRELSVIAVRGLGGEFRCYPLVENVHSAGILRLSRAPAPGADHLQAKAEQYARLVAESLDYVGVLALEFFEIQTDSGPDLLINEMAPRVHNSGHWTIEGAVCSQFENHLRAVSGLPLGGTAALGACVMLNLIGELPDPAALLAIPGAHLHDYGKEPRPGRKVGHVTLTAPDPSRLDDRLASLRAAISPRATAT
ncbi:MAG: 5-(carboxyamino)imidazole ribonucleotide synthase [Phycisphaeraceae bacterium]|nr:5-(carboxyamino)imidazole ribonucleotide synthase [Phycisphaeraceae bacterium]